MGNRPFGITIIAALWTLGSAFNLYVGCYGIATDLGVLQLRATLSDSYPVPEWARFTVLTWYSAPDLPKWAIPAELMIDCFIVALAFLALYTVYGLWKAKSWSYYTAHAIPIFAAMATITLTGLYLSLYPMVDVKVISASFIIFLLDLVWVIALWGYFRKMNVKQYLKQALPPQIVEMLSHQ